MCPFTNKKDEGYEKCPHPNGVKAVARGRGYWLVLVADSAWLKARLPARVLVKAVMAACARSIVWLAGSSTGIGWPLVGGAVGVLIGGGGVGTGLIITDPSPCH